MGPGDHSVRDDQRAAEPRGAAGRDQGEGRQKQEKQNLTFIPQFMAELT